MRKNVILKIILDIGLFLITSFLVYWLFYCATMLNTLYKNMMNTVHKDIFIPTIVIFFVSLIFSISQIVINILFFIHLNIRDIPFLKQLVFKTYAENKERIKEERKEKKQAKLKAEIAEKQAMLDEMKKE